MAAIGNRVVVFRYAKVFMHSCSFYQKSVLYLLASLKKNIESRGRKSG